MDSERVIVLVDRIASDFSEQVVESLAERLASLMIVGSYARGRIAPQRPDLNYALVWKERGAADDYLVLGNVLSSLIAKYLDEAVIRPEFRPYKFAYPAARKELDVFLNVSCLHWADRERKFFISDAVLSGWRRSRKVIFGEDFLKNMSLAVSKQSIRDVAMPKLLSHKLQLDRVPLVYDVSRDFDLILNESLDHGKNLAAFGVELAMSEEELDAEEYLRVIADGEALEAFYRERFDDVAASAIAVILEARENYREWKRSRKRAEVVYRAAFRLHEKLAETALRQGEETR